MHDKVLIVDFGSQVTQLIARRVREEKVYSEIVPYQKAEAAFREMKPKAIILSGGPSSVYADGAPDISTDVFTAVAARARTAATASRRRALEALRALLVRHESPQGVFFQSSAWIIRAQRR